MTCLALLAQLPESYVYIDPFKLGAFVVVFLLWVLFAQWVDKDTLVVNTFRTLWNLIVVGSGTAAIILGLFVPIFWLSFPLLLVINLVVFLVYVVHRNGLVREDDKVMTAAHFRRLKEQGLFGKKKNVKEVKERVRLTAADHRVVAIPEDEAEREQYRLVQDLVFDALWRRAVGVEVAPAGQVAKVSYQIDGIPTEREGLTRADGDAVILFLKKIAGLNLEERRKPQKGQIVAAVGDKHMVIVRTDGSTAGEKLTLRILYKEATLKVPDLGFNPKQLDVVEKLKEVSHGLILVSAPPQCGLTTTIYSFVRTHDRFLQNVRTIEYEKEMDLDNVTQEVFSPASGKAFHEVLLKLVRSDPDIIVLPELRDKESAVVAAQAASQKQKIYVGLVALDVFDALRKWVALLGDRALVAKSLLAVSSQRLVRVLCTQCKQAYKPDAQMMRKLNLPPDHTLYRPPEPQFDKHGQPIICQACQGTGYVGRTAVFDWLAVDDGLRDVITRSSSLNDVQSYAVKKGGLGLQAQALQKVLDGITSIQEVARVVRASGPPGPAGVPKRGSARPPGPATPRPQPKPRPSAPAAGSPGGS